MRTATVFFFARVRGGLALAKTDSNRSCRTLTATRITACGTYAGQAPLSRREEKSPTQLAATLPRKASENASVMV